MTAQAVDYLVKLLGDFIKEPKLMVVAGHPGSGKTTIASYICLYAMVNNERCLYVSLQEDRDKLFKQLKSVGIDFAFYEGKDLLKFVKIPVILSEEGVQNLLDGLSRAVVEYSPRVVIIDAVTPILQNIEKDVKVRAYLQNYFWELQKAINGSIVLISEIPIGEERIGIGWIEFVADAVLILKHRVRGGLLERFMEIRKIRGREVVFTEIPFTIRSEGVSFHPPIALEMIRAPIKRRVIAVHNGKDVKISEVEAPPLSIYVEYPPGLTPWIPIAYSLLIHLIDKYTKVLFIDYNFCETDIRFYLSQLFRKFGLDDELVNEVLKKVDIRVVNPSMYSLPELTSYIMKMVNEVKPNILIIHDVSTAWIIAKEDPKIYATLLYNMVFELKSKGIDVVRIGSYVDPMFSYIGKLVSIQSVSITCSDVSCRDYIVHITTPTGIAKLSFNEFEEVVNRLARLLKEVKQEISK